VGRVVSGGATVGDWDGTVGLSVGGNVGISDGTTVGDWEGAVGVSVGENIGRSEGIAVGNVVGLGSASTSSLLLSWVRLLVFFSTPAFGGRLSTPFIKAAFSLSPCWFALSPCE
jgi:hypothetical protein